MSLLGKRLRQGGRYAYNYFDMDRHNSTVFSNFYGSRCSDFLLSGDWLDSVHNSKNDNGHYPICRSMLSASSRCLSSLFSRLSLGCQQTLANPDTDAGQTLLPERHNYNCSGRHLVPSHCGRKWVMCCLWRRVNSRSGSLG